MKKVSLVGAILIMTLSLFCLGYHYKNNLEPHTYYQVYLGEKVLGMIESKEQLEQYIDEKGEEYKELFGVDTVYAPNDLQIKKITTYKQNYQTVEAIYDEILDLEPFTVKGYQLTIHQEEEKVKLYVTEESMIEEALETTIITFVGKEKYQAYKEEEQEKIENTGSAVQNIYIDNSMTIKQMQISVTEQIYTEANELSQFLLFGEEPQKSTYVVQSGDTISTVAFNNKISEEEFLISNPTFSSANNLLFVGQEVTIGITNPQISVVLEEYTVQDVVNKYSIEERYDSNRIIGDDEVLQEGEDGLERVSSNIKTVNGTISYVDQVSKEELKPTINRIVVKGEKYIPNVASGSWAWPTESGWILSSSFGYRINPFSGYRELHDAIDLAGAGGYGSNIYVANNGIVTTATWHNSYGYYIVINHNNGYYTLYAHLSKMNVEVGQTVAKGSVIGQMGMTGSATGPHLHFGLYVGEPMHGGYAVNPLILY